MTVSAVAFFPAFGLVRHPFSRLATGAPAARAASVAAPEVLRKSLLFQLAFICLSFTAIPDVFYPES
jgi:hypothetical protein